MSKSAHKSALCLQILVADQLQTQHLPMITLELSAGHFQLLGVMNAAGIETGVPDELADVSGFGQLDPVDPSVLLDLLHDIGHDDQDVIDTVLQLLRGHYCRGVSDQTVVEISGHLPDFVRRQVFSDHVQRITGQQLTAAERDPGRRSRVYRTADGDREDLIPVKTVLQESELESEIMDVYIQMTDSRLELQTLSQEREKRHQLVPRPPDHDVSVQAEHPYIHDGGLFRLSVVRLVKARRLDVERGRTVIHIFLAAFLHLRHAMDSFSNKFLSLIGSVILTAFRSL